ncbi:hypothetical protein HanRHA438_Chr06g0270941 [Helianthus annuus]|nr:hypothetical protein HanRHA438_Chr06g0270941 [Helianthus annuus]
MCNLDGNISELSTSSVGVRPLGYVHLLLNSLWDFRLCFVYYVLVEQKSR